MKNLLILCVFFSFFIPFSAFAQQKQVAVVPLVRSKTAPQGFFVAFGHVSSLGNLLTSYGVLSSSRTAIGRYTVILDKNYSAVPVVTATAINNLPTDEIVTWYHNFPVSGNTLFFYVTDGSGIAADANFSFILYGQM